MSSIKSFDKSISVADDATPEEFTGPTNSYFGTPVEPDGECSNPHTASYSKSSCNDSSAMYKWSVKQSQLPSKSSSVSTIMPRQCQSIIDAIDINLDRKTTNSKTTSMTGYNTITIYSSSSISHRS
ncbi:hypothetical protein ACLB2K_047423 [Fragaria x ananassa]